MTVQGLRLRMKKGAAEDVGVAVKAVEPEGVAEDGDGLVGGFFLGSEDAADEGRNAEGGKDAGGEAAGDEDFRVGSAGELVGGGGIGAERGEGAVGVGVGGDFAGGDAEVESRAEAVAGKDEAIGMVEGKRAQEDAVDEGEDGGGGSDAEGEGEDDGEGEAGRFAQAAGGVAEVLDCVVEPDQGALVAVKLAGVFHSSIGAAGGEAGLIGG